MKRGLVGAFVMVAALAASSADASVSIRVSWDGLLRESTAAVVATPAEATTVWENGRIVTYTRLHVDRAIAGELGAGSDAWVRTLGGVVGKIGQSVDGEAVFTQGQPGLLFLHPGPPGAYVVTARGQGQFPIVPDADPAAASHLVKSSAAGLLLLPQAPGPPSLFASEMVHGRKVDEVAHDVVAAWDRTHVH
jgi:hypothetical protein